MRVVHELSGHEREDSPRAVVGSHVGRSARPLSFGRPEAPLVLFPAGTET